LPDVLTTRPYYRSAYVFVTRPEVKVHSLEDPQLRRLRVGIHVVGNDYAPPAAPLARRGIVANLVGFSLFGEYGEDNPPARLIEAVARGCVDVAIAWGPLGGYFASRQPVPLDVTPIPPSADMPWLPLEYSISFAVREGDHGLRAALDRALAARAVEVRRILDEYRSGT
jgi:mxaJ protein